MGGGLPDVISLIMCRICPKNRSAEPSASSAKREAECSIGGGSVLQLGGSHDLSDGDGSFVGNMVGPQLPPRLHFTGSCGVCSIVLGRGDVPPQDTFEAGVCVCVVKGNKHCDDEDRFWRNVKLL